LFGGEVWYKYKFPNGKERLIPAADVLHIRGLGYDGLKGYPVLSIMRDSLGAAIAARDHSGPLLQATAPGRAGSSSIPASCRRKREPDAGELGAVAQGARQRPQDRDSRRGGGLRCWSGDARSAQLLESREFDAREIANIFGVPTHKLGDPSKVAYNSLGEENQSYYDDTLSRWLTALVGRV
jgi:phage portal protein BeeE